MRHEDHDAHGAHVMTHSLSFAVVRSVALKLVGGTEPHKFYNIYIHRTHQSWKDKMRSFSSNSKPMYLIIITHYSAQTVPCIIFTQNQCLQRLRLLLLESSFH